MQPSKTYEKIILLVNQCGKVCGVDLVSPNYRVNILTLFMFLCIAVFYTFLGYTVYVKMQEGFVEVLASFTMFGKGSQGLCKLICGVLMHKQYAAEDKFLRSIYVEYELKGQNYTQALQKSVKRILIAAKILASLYMAGCGLSIVMPLLLRLYDGRRILIMQFLIPGLDVETTYGYVVTLTVQMLLFAFAGFGNFGGDFLIFDILTHVTLFVDIFQLKISELNALSAEDHNPNCLESLLDVLKWHQTYTKFTENCDHLFFWIIFTQITTAAVSIIVTLVIILKGDWINAYTFICLEFSMMYMYCGMGTLIEVANESMTKELYAIHWYNLDVDQQKIIRLMLMMSQSPKELTVGGVMPLSVNTGLQVTKTVYSVLMMLLNRFAD